MEAVDDPARTAYSESRPVHERLVRARELVGAVFVWTVWASATLASVSYIHRYARNVPFFDDLTVVSVMTGHEPLTYEWASAQYNEHRNVIPRLLQVGLLRVIPDFRAGLYLNVGLLSAAAASMIVLAHRIRGRNTVADVVLPLSILTVGQCECLLVGFALNLVMTAWIAWSLIAVMGRSPHPPSWWSCLQVGGLLVLLPLSGGSGMAMLPPLTLWLAGYVACGWWTSRDPGSSARAIGLSLLMTTSATVTWYLSGYARPTHIPRASSWSAVCSTTLEVCSLVASPVGWSHPVVAGLAVVLLACGTAVLLAITARTSPGERPRALGLMAVLASMFGIALAVGYSRSGLGPGSGAYSRYITITTPLLGVVYFSWLLYGSAAARRVVQFGMLALICVGMPAQYQSARDVGHARRDLYARIERGLESGMRPDGLLDLACPRLFPDRVIVYRCFRMLRDAQVGAFCHMAEDDQKQAVQADLEKALR